MLHECCSMRRLSRSVTFKMPDGWRNGQRAKKGVAQILIDSKVLALTSDKVTSADDKSEQEVEDLLEEITMALVGAYAKAGGHFYSALSAAQLWSWMDKDVPFRRVVLPHLVHIIRPQPVLPWTDNNLRQDERGGP
eukprot:5255263-Amphidinium_carterae.2